MPLPGRIEGRMNGAAYEIKQGDTLMKSIPLAEARGDKKLARAILQNKWEPVP